MASSRRRSFRSLLTIRILNQRVDTLLDAWIA